VIAVIRRAVAPAADQAGDQMKDPETAIASRKAVLHALNEAARNMEDASGPGIDLEPARHH
jgi:hypothetical protein